MTPNEQSAYKQYLFKMTDDLLDAETQTVIKQEDDDREDHEVPRNPEERRGMIEHPVGERFDHHGRTIECVLSGEGCSFCAFHCEYTIGPFGNCPQRCRPSEREDMNMVLFKEIPNEDNPRL